MPKGHGKVGLGLINAIPDTNHNTNPITLTVTVRVTLTLLTLPTLLTLLTLILDTVVNKAPTSQGFPNYPQPFFVICYVTY